MVATIQTRENRVYEKLKEVYDKREGILGFGKTYVQKYYCDSFTIDKNVFQALEEKYYYNIQKLKNNYPNLIFSNDANDEKIGERVTIMARSSQRIDLARPLLTIKNIFTPKNITISPLQIKYLLDTDHGQEIINRL